MAWKASVAACSLLALIPNTAAIMQKVQPHTQETQLRIVGHIGKKQRTQQDGLLTAESQRADDMHLAFVTDCSSHQKWMAMTLLHSAGRVGQTDPITWLRFGCDEDKLAARDAEENLLLQVYPAAGLLDIDQHGEHLPDVSWIKPFAFKGFLSHPEIENSTVVAMLDADFIFMSRLRLDDLEEHHLQSVGTNVSEAEVKGLHGVVQHYLCCDGAGAPYMFSGQAWRELLPEYCRLAGQAAGNWGDEQMAFAAAARSANVTFSVFDHFAVSDLKSQDAEGWKWVHQHLETPGAGNCTLPMAVGTERMPTFLHVVRPWNPEGGFTTWQFSKYQVPPGFRHREAEGLLDCDMALLAEPPATFVKDMWEYQGDETKRLSAWGLCGIIHSVNEMLLDVKRLKCPAAHNTDKILKIEANWQNSFVPDAEGPSEGHKRESKQEQSEFVKRCGLWLDCVHRDVVPENDLDDV